MRLGYALEGYWLEKRRQFSRHTVSDYSVTFRRLEEYLGTDTEVGAVKPDDIRRFLVLLAEEEGLSKKSLSNVWTALSSFWSWAEVELGVGHILRGKVARPEYRRAQIVPYSEAEIKALLAATGSDGRHSRRPTGLRDYAMLVVLVDTGVRVSELVGFTLADYMQAQGRLAVRAGKGEKARAVFLGQVGRRAVWRYLSMREEGRPGEPLFVTRSGRALDRHAVRHLVVRLARQAGVGEATVHRFRHTFAVTFLRNGGSPLELQELLGHERLDTVRIYVRLAETDLADAQRRASPADHWRL